MNLLIVLLLLLLIACGIVAAVPVVTLGLVSVLALGSLLIWFLPILIIVASDRTSGSEKLAWILAIVFLSWFAWIFYFLLAPVKASPRPGYAPYRYD